MVFGLTNSMEKRLVRKFHTFFGSQPFITMFTGACHFSPVWSGLIHSMFSHPEFLRSILILSSHLYPGLPWWLFPSVFPTKTLHKFHHMGHTAWPFHLLCFEQPDNSWWVIWIMKLLITQFCSYFLPWKFRCVSTLFLNTLNLCSPVLWETKFHTHIKQQAKLYFPIL